MSREEAEGYNEIEQEVYRLKEILFVIGEMAITSFDDSIVGLVDKTIPGFRIPKRRFEEIVNSLKERKTTWVN